MRFDPEIFDAARQEFLSHLRYAKGHRATTCYAYNADLGQWRDWLQQAGKDWQRARASDVEQFAAWQLRERKVSAHIVNRRLSCLSSFYKWALKHEIVEADPVYLADKPKRPLRIPVWLEKEEQQQLEATLKDRRNIPINIFGNNQERMTETRRRDERRFGLLLNSGLRISEALALKAADVRILEGTARTSCATPTPPTCSTPGRSGWTSRRCSGTRASVPPRFTPTSARSGWSRGWRGCER